MSEPASWVLAAILTMNLPDGPGGDAESDASRLWRMREIASDIYAVGHDDRERALLLAVAVRETGLAYDADKGPCYRGPGSERRCDSGRSACIMQIRLGRGKTEQGWSQADLFADRRKCLEAGRRLLERSSNACGRGRELNAYATGSCSKGADITADRMRLMWRLLSYSIAYANHNHTN